MDLNPMPPAWDLADAVRAGTLSAVELLDTCLANIAERDDALHAFVCVDADLARDQAAAIDARVASGEDPGPFAGVPFGVKDIEDVAGFPITHGSAVYDTGEPAAADSIHISRLRAAGAVFVGTTVASEFGTLHYMRNMIHPLGRNPWNIERTPGGSSGGSAAAVSAGMVPIATSGDGGGSTRIPASFCGNVGFKPSFGRIPDPAAARDSQTAVKGVQATTVRDAARHLDVAAGPDPRVRTSLPSVEGLYEEAIESLDVSGLRVGWSSTLGYADPRPDVVERTEEAATALIAAAGLTVVDVDIDWPDPVKAWMGGGYLDLWLELEREHWPDRKDDFTPFVAWALGGTEQMPSGMVAAIHKRRTKLEAAVGETFGDIDVLLTPTNAVPAFGAEGPEVDPDAGPPHLSVPRATVPFTMPANICWNPACSVPAGLVDGLPVGLQIMGGLHADALVLRLANVYEQARPWPRHAPSK
ncbi:MAG TPA: amidase [Acidimicrobiales bacterium]|jgi:aspartyl-tRNA(Asn)/glutamyl-tRNA(Gln) amidotransferase subunit A